VSLDRLFKVLDIPIDYTIEYDQLSRGMLEKYRLFLCFRDGMVWPDGYLGPDAYTDYEGRLENSSRAVPPKSQTSTTEDQGEPIKDFVKDFAPTKPKTWITEDQGAAIRDFVSAGNGFYALHNSSHISLSSKNYRDVMGGRYIGHPPLRPFRVRASQNQHPITQGVQEFMVNDEQHYVEYDKDKSHIILESENIDGLVYEELGTKSISGWAYDFGKGRVVFTAVGHTIYAIRAPEYFQIQKRSVLWLLKQL
jgi:type 1 glutamine amidotransferase